MMSGAKRELMGMRSEERYLRSQYRSSHSVGELKKKSYNKSHVHAEKINLTSVHSSCSNLFYFLFKPCRRLSEPFAE